MCIFTMGKYICPFLQTSPKFFLSVPFLHFSPSYLFFPDDLFQFIRAFLCSSCFSPILFRAPSATSYSIHPSSSSVPSSYVAVASSHSPASITSSHYQYNPFPSLNKWRKLSHFSLSNNFSLVTYNILAPKYTTAEKFPYCSSQHRAWAHRFSLIKNAIGTAPPDVVCMQELQLSPEPRHNHSVRTCMYIYI